MESAYRENKGQDGGGHRDKGAHLLALATHLLPHVSSSVQIYLVTTIILG